MKKPKKLGYVGVLAGLLELNGREAVKIALVKGTWEKVIYIEGDKKPETLKCPYGYYVQNGYITNEGNTAEGVEPESFRICTHKDYEKLLISNK